MEGKWKLAREAKVTNRKFTNIYIYIISFLGWFGVFLSLFWMKPLEHITIVGLLIFFLFICEFFPISTWRGTLSFSFPILFTLYILDGVTFSVLIFAVILFFINFLRQKPIKQAFFESGYQSLSLILALVITDLSFKFIFRVSLEDIFNETLYILVVNSLYSLIKYSLYNVKLILKSSIVPLNWWRKNAGDLIVFVLSLFYCWLMFYLGHQDRGQIDALSFFFFFTPLVGISLVSTIITRLEKEKRRLNMLFSLTNEFKQGVATSSVATKIVAQLKDFLPIDSSVFWIKENNLWKTTFLLGEVNAHLTVTNNVTEWFKTLTETIYVTQRGTLNNPGLAFFGVENKSFIFAPLYIENELVGVWGVGSHRAFAYQKDDILSMKALAIQIAILIRTRRLIKEQENHKILEERNRIAREIHDGIAQRIAGAVMNLEAANKSFDTREGESRKLVQESLTKLRGSLKDIRESIYALRPQPTQQVGIVQALIDQIERFNLENPTTEVHFQKKGEETSLSYIIENAIFNVLREALRNIQKHAQATLVHVVINFKESRVVLRVKDNGTGFSLMDAMIKAKDEPHFGIINMHELAEGMGATLDISSKVGQGTEITLVVQKNLGETGGNHD